MSLEDQVRQILESGKKWAFTLEPGKGTTYETNEPTLYGHSRYESSSVLAGKPQRVFVWKWKTWDEAEQELKTLSESVPAFRYAKLNGSSHIPLSKLLADIPDDTDY